MTSYDITTVAVSEEVLNAQSKTKQKQKRHIFEKFSQQGC